MINTKANSLNSNNHTVNVIINRNKCDGCGDCILKCKYNVLRISEISKQESDQLHLLGKIKTLIKGRMKAYVDNQKNCIICKECEENCHEHAIQVLLSIANPV